ncbi:tyrosine-type recombinase/integrase [Oryzihumus leptocrescens]|nr:tyrosine-type recombinase/integrase [Oryzihumus leptocrescens]
MRVRAITRQDVKAWDTWLKTTPNAKGNPRGPDIRRNCHALLHSALGYAVDEGLIGTNPAEGIRQRHRTKRSQAAKAVERTPLPSADTVNAVVRALPHRADRLLLLLLAWSGPRLSEATALPRVGALSRTTPNVRFERVAVKPVGKPWTIEPLKTGLARDVPIPTGLWRLLLSHQDSLSAPTRGRWDVLFPSRPASGRHRQGPGFWTRESWRDVWSQVLPPKATEDGDQDPGAREEDAANADPQRQALAVWTVRALRPYAASVLYAAGAPATDAQEMLGHRTLGTTLGYYLRAVPEVKKDNAAEAIRLNADLTMPQRLDQLWDLWVARYGDPLEGAI